MSIAVDATATRVESRRIARPDAQFTATYRPHDRAFAAAPGSLEYFLTERYCLYHLARRGVPYRLDIHHPPWQLRRGEAVLHRNTMAEANGFTLPSTAPVLHYSKRQDMVAWAPSFL
jgi:uncharacterized protein YqjF (DUF2071 family)